MFKDDKILVQHSNQAFTEAEIVVPNTAAEQKGRLEMKTKGTCHWISIPWEPVTVEEGLKYKNVPLMAPCRETQFIWTSMSGDCETASLPGKLDSSFEPEEVQ